MGMWAAQGRPAVPKQKKEVLEASLTLHDMWGVQGTLLPSLVTS